DLYVSANQYCDEGGSVQVVSTSQLEAIHSKLRKLLDRVVSVQFVGQHKLKSGATHGRNPVLSAFAKS
ncbi:hypothetical protein JG688_00008080, partial [Phytophthora aleatoria]